MAAPNVALPEQDFFNYSKSIVKNFLQSVVVVDDQAAFTDTPEEIPKTVASPSGFRGGRREVVAVTPEDPAPKNLKDDDSSSAEMSEVLNVKNLNDCFAENGLVCSVLRPTEQETDLIIGKAEHVARRADILIFDWKLSPHESPVGKTALNCIHAVLTSDTAQGDRISSQSRKRLIAIYTSMLDLDNIAIEAQKGLAEKGVKLDFDGEFILHNSSTKIVFYRKDRGTGVKKNVQARTVSEENLTDCLINDFTAMTNGLLSNTALMSIGALRDNIHRLLNKFESRLDPSYLTHRSLVSPSEEAQQHPVAFITSEFHDILEDCAVDKSVEPDIIKLWLRAQINNNKLTLDKKTAPINDLNKKVAEIDSEGLENALLSLISKGIESEIRSTELVNWKSLLSSVKKKQDRDSQLTGLLIDDNTSAIRDLDFSILTTMRTQYNNPMPILSLGTIVCSGNVGSEKYYVCIQPVCDSVRLQPITVFPFLRLDDSTEINGKGDVINPAFGIVVVDHKVHKKLRVNLRPRNITLLSFKAGESKEVRAQLSDAGDYLYHTSDGTQELRWIGSLKFAQAQRIANDFAAEISRVGLIESDWLRRMR